MAEIPQAQLPDELPQVQPDTQVPANVTPDLFGAGVASAASQVGSEMQREYVWANQAAVTAQVNQLSDHTERTVYDAKTGIINQDKGLKAPEAVDGVIQSHQELISTLSAGLSNDAQRQMFQRQAAEHMRGLDQHLNMYEARQVQGANNANTEAYIKNTSQSAIRFANDPPPGNGQPDPISVRIDQVKAAISHMAEVNGQAADSPYTQLQTNNAVSDIHAGVVDARLAAGNVQGADAYLNANKDAITKPQELDRLTRAVSGNMLDNRAQVFANSYLMNGSKPSTMSEFLAKVDSDDTLSKNAALYDKVIERGERHFAIQERAMQADQRGISDTVAKAIVADPTINPKDAVPASDWQKLPGSVQEQLIMRQKQLITKEEPKRYSPYYFQFQDLVAKHPEVAKNENLYAHFGDVNPEDFKEMHAWQQELNGDGGTPGGGKMTKIISTKDIMDGYLGGIGLDDSKANLSIDGKAQKLKFQQEFQYSADFFSETHGGKQPTAKDLSDIGQKIVEKYGEKTFWGTQHYLFEQPDKVVRDSLQLGLHWGNTPRMTEDEISGWANALSDKARKENPQKFAADNARLLKWKNGIGDDNRTDENLKDRWAILNERIFSTKK